MVRVILLILHAVLSLWQHSSVFADIAEQDSINHLSISKIAVVDFQFVIENSIAVDKAREEISKISNNITQDLSKKEAQMKTLKDTLLRKRDSVAKIEEYEKEVNNYHQEVTDIQHQVRKQKLQLEQAHANVMQKVIFTMFNIISDISKEKGLGLVIRSSSVLYAEDSLDITNRVVQELNEKLPSVALEYYTDLK